MIPFALMTADGRSRSLNAQRLVNMFAEKAGPGAKTAIILRSTPGLSTFGDAGTGVVRGLHKMNIANAETLFAVIGTDLYEIDSGGTETLRGSAGTIAGSGFVFMASNANDELMIANSSGAAWLWDASTLATVVSYDADFTDDATSLTFLDQYIIFTKANTGQVHAFDLNTGKSYDPLSFGTAEASPDNAVQAYGFAGNLWVFGEGTTEVWYNAATIPFPFARIGGVVFEDIGGVLNTVADVDNSIIFLGSDGIVYAATQFQPQRISTHDIENRIRGWVNHYAFTYKDEGHAFYVLGSDSGCVVFDRTTGFWHERESFTVGRWRASSYAFVYGKHIVGDYLIGRLYEMSLSNYEDGANALQRRIISPPLYADGVYMSVPWVQVNFEHGVGVSGQGSFQVPTAFEVKSTSGSNLAAEATTNLLLWSENPDKLDWTWGGIDHVTAGQTDPLGGSTAYLVIGDGFSGDEYYQDYTPGGVIPQVPFTFSYWVNSRNANNRLTMYEVGGASGNQTVVGSLMTSDGTLTRYEMTYTPTKADRTTIRVGLRVWANTVIDADVWGAMLEQDKSSASLYLKTESSTATRTAGPAFVGYSSDNSITVNTDGWYTSEDAILLAGDEIYLTINGIKEVYTVASDVSSDASGLADVIITKSLYEPAQGTNPQVIMDWSDDGGQTYGNEHWGSIGKIGEYRKRAVWRRTGTFRERVYRLTYTDPTKFTVYGASL